MNMSIRHIQARDITGTFLDQVINNHAAFVQNKIEAGNWIISAGLRWDHFNTFGDTVNPRVSAGYRITTDSKIRGSFGKAFRAPAAGDLFYPFYGNPDLKPEKSKSWEIGYDHYTRNAEFSASWFRSDFDDLITFDPLTFLAGNVAKARTQGLELSGSVKVNAWKFSAITRTWMQRMKSRIAVSIGGPGTAQARRQRMKQPAGERL